MQPMVDFKRRETDNGDGQPTTTGVLARKRVLQVGAQERDKVWPSLRYKEVINIEELGNTGERRFPIRIAGLPPGTEGDFLTRSPGNNGPGFILALQNHWRIKSGGGCVGSEGRRPDELHVGVILEASVDFWHTWHLLHLEP